MSADFEKVLVKDPRLDVSDSIKYAVIKGGQNVTMAPYNAISYSNSQIVFNVQVPSEQTIIDRRVLLSTDLELCVVTDEEGAVGASGCYYGIWSALACFPLHQLMTVMSATINNNTVSINIRDVLPVMTRLLDCEDLVTYNSSTPTFVDTYASYSPLVAGVGISHPNAAYWAVDDTSKMHRGGFAPKQHSLTVGETSTVEVFKWQLIEPLLLSPFFFSNLKSNNQGFYGIQNLNFVFNVGGLNRVFRGLGVGAAGNANAASESNPSPGALIANTRLNGITGVFPGNNPNGTGNMFSNTRLLFNFLTPHPSDLLPARNIVPFYELPRYITPQSVNLAASPAAAASGLIYSAADNTQEISTNSLQLNQIPDKLLLYVRKVGSSQSWGDADVAYPITGVKINFNNNSGILASAQTVDLWQMSRNNGVRSTWNDWKGGAVVEQSSYTPAVASGTVATTPPVTTPAVPAEYPAFPASVASVMTVAPTFGSYLALEFGKDIQLTEDFYAAGSLGNFNIQIYVTVANNQPYAIGSTNPSNQQNNLEIVLVTMNSGVFVCERGTSSTYTGILTKQDVLEASQQEHYTHDDVARMVGGGFFDSLKSGFSKLASKGLEHGKKFAMKHGKKMLKSGAKMAMAHGKKALKKYMPPPPDDDDEEEEEE
jgi:hypothetical protein